jgi:hypothetical protein
MRGGVAAARAERELSEKRLAETEPLRRTFHEMIEQNHVAGMVSDLVRERREGNSGNGAPAG